MSSEDDKKYFQLKVPGRTYVSRPFNVATPSMINNMRYVSRVFDTNNQLLGEAISKGEVILRAGMQGKREIKAKIFEVSRKIDYLVIQKYVKNNDNLSPTRQAFTFKGEEIKALKLFLNSLDSIDLPADEGVRLSDSDIEDQLEFIDRYPELADDIARKYIEQNPQSVNLIDPAKLKIQIKALLQDKKARSLFDEVIKEENLDVIQDGDIQDVASKRISISEFESLLTDSEFFNRRKMEIGKSKDEEVWQHFFEVNKWILGYGLEYVFCQPVRKEQYQAVLKGGNIIGRGLKPDGLARSKGAINFLRIVELKLPTSELVVKYRNSDEWRAGDDLVGGVNQCQRYSYESVEILPEEFKPKDKNGNYIGDKVFRALPKSILIVGTLTQFTDEDGNILNPNKVACFENFRQSIKDTEIITFDELLERARFILGETSASASIPKEEFSVKLTDVETEILPF